ncbi:MAG: hypothetical protein RBU23_02755 [Candidatus Auribacterota bacterium]|jgi:hypothetical protein|nr:hypothetical protein [Candidatus Auribacterota bacterium]
MKRLFIVLFIAVLFFSPCATHASDKSDQTETEKVGSQLIVNELSVMEKPILLAPAVLPAVIELPRVISFVTLRPAPQPIIRPIWVEMKGLLKTVINSDKKIGAELFDNSGNLIARLTSQTIDFKNYNRLLVYVAGYQLYPLPTPDSITPDSAVPTIDVKKIEIISPWVDKKGKLVAIVAMVQGNDSNGTSTGQSYSAGLFDDNGVLTARLVSEIIPLTKYDGKLVEIGGYQVGYPTLIQTAKDASSAVIIPTIDVRKIAVLPVWITKHGFIKASPILSANQEPEILPEPTPVPALYRGKLLDNDGNVIANLISKTVPLFRYNGLYVEIQGYLYPEITPVLEIPENISVAPALLKAQSKDLSILPIVPLINVMKLKVIHYPPPIETWRGIIKPRITDSPTLPDAPFMLIAPDGTAVGYLTAKTNEMAALLKKLSINYLVAVTGAVYPVVNQPSNVELKLMVVEKIVVLEDLRHIIRMSAEPLVFHVGEKVYFNKIADIIRPVILPVDDVSSRPADSRYPFLYQKAWDFDTLLYSSLSENEDDNDAEYLPIIQTDDDAMPPLVPIDYVQYDYKYDSRFRCASERCIDEPVYEFKMTGIYRITITCELIDENGFTLRQESASRIIQVFPQIDINEENAEEWLKVLELSNEIQEQSQLVNMLSELMKKMHDTAMAIIRNMK